MYFIFCTLLIFNVNLSGIKNYANINQKDESEHMNAKIKEKVQENELFERNGKDANSLKKNKEIKIKEYILKNKERLKEYQKTYRMLNKKKLKETLKEYYLKHKEKLNEKHKLYRIINKKTENEKAMIRYMKKKKEKNHNYLLRKNLYSWKDKESVRNFFDSNSKLFHISQLSDWYRISMAQICKVGGNFDSLFLSLSLP